MSTQMIEIENEVEGQAAADVDGQTASDVLDLHVVVLINYMRKHHVVSYQALAKRVRKLTILLSTPMEKGRDWTSEWEGLDVRVQKNVTITRKWRHSSGFTEDNFIHVPVDTTRQLRQLRPDIIFSYEMGVRTLLSWMYRSIRRSTPLVMVGNMSRFIEQERGLGRRLFRQMIRRTADWFTYNGPSCRQYMASIGIPEKRMMPIPYCIDDAVVYEGKRAPIPADRPRRLFFCGSLLPRKGLVPVMERLNQWCQQNPDRSVEFRLAGDGPVRNELEALQRENLKTIFLGQLNAQQLREAHRDVDIALMPSFADEWGLTTVEAWASGLPVIGSLYAQSVEALLEEGVNGWALIPDQPETIDHALEQALALTPSQLDAMVPVCRKSVAHISAEATADRFCDVIRAALPHRFDFNQTS